ncbi:hypothetical protein UQW22_01920 [Isoptericola halotolerans]|uniref:hypothetical protein n=1 Tax=Isoptericola halotolerans TaxID=300560 RepID=UPI00388F88F2
MSAMVLRWSTGAVVTMHDWGVIVHDERGAHQLRGSGLEQPVSWLQARLTEPTDLTSLLVPLPEPKRPRVRRLVDSLVARGAITVMPAEEPLTSDLRVELRVSAHPVSEAIARKLADLLSPHFLEPPFSTAPVPGDRPTIDGHVRSMDASERAPSFRLVIVGQDLWFGQFGGEEADRVAGAEELSRYLGQEDVKACSSPTDGIDAWLPWIARTMVDARRAGVHDGDRCVRLTVDPFALHEHRLVRVVGDRAHGSLDDEPDDLADPLVLSRRCAHLVDDVTSPLAVPSESRLQQLPLQLSRSASRLADGSRETAVGHGWTLEHARGHAVGQAVLNHGIARLEPHVRANPLAAREGRPDESVVLRRDDVLKWLAQYRGVASLGATAERATHQAATRLAAHCAMTDGQVAWQRAPLSSATRGAELLAIHQECGEVLVARGLPFSLVALRVAPDAAVWGVSDRSPQEAAERAVVQALLFHQSGSPGNEAAPPRTYPLPSTTAAAGPAPAHLVDVLARHGMPLVVPLSGGPTIDAALPHQALVLLISGGSRP